MTITTQLDTAFRAAITAAFGIETDPLIVPSQNEKFGDYQSNAAMGLAKKVGGNTGNKLNPRQVAEMVKAKLDLGAMATPDGVSIAGPGFINIKLDPAWLASFAKTQLSDDRLGVSLATERQTVVVDYSGPNVAKQMHVGHLRSTIIGDAVARALELLGHRVVRQNHIGDFGTQFGMLIHHLRSLGLADQSLTIEDLDRYYKEATVRFRADPAFADVARKTVVELQSGGEQAVEIWNRMRIATRQQYTEVYKLLNVSLTEADERGESYYRDRLQPTVDRLKAALPMTDDCFTGPGPAVAMVVTDDEDETDLPTTPTTPAAEKETQEGPTWTVVKPFTTVSGGATCVFLPNWTGRDGNPLPMIVQKRDGGFPYSATDVAALYFRVCEAKSTPADQQPVGHDWRATRVIYFTDARQAQHFAMVFDTFRATGWGQGVTLNHAPFGSMLGEDGRPFKTRSGDAAKLKDLVDEAVERAMAIAERVPSLSDEQKKQVAQAVGIGAIKYADLSKDRGSDYVFSWDKMLAMDGNTAPYLQYAYARIRSIFRKADVTEADPAAIALNSPFEIGLVKQLARFGDTVDAVARELKPHLLCTYLYDLASRFSSFYENCPVLQSDGPTRASRLALCDLTARVMARGLDLLGIEHPEQM
jgi:arginyl-tRNA synthetase